MILYNNVQVKRVIEYFNMYNLLVYLCYLDASKDFDKVNHWHRFSKLIDRKLPSICVLLNHSFPPKWFLWQPKLHGIATMSLLTRIPNMVTIGLKLTTTVRSCLFYNNFSVKQ